MRKPKYRKRPEVEIRIGMTIESYIRVSGEKGLNQREMAHELGVTEMTMGKWLREAGLVKTACYRPETV